jgi:excisionase family DNA binding protein
MADEGLLTLREAATVLRLHPQTVRRRVADGQLRALRLGRAANAPLRFLPDDLAALVRPAGRRP